MDCLRRKHAKKRDSRRHHVSPNHSQPSTLNTTVNSTLPKAGSTGLWIDKPGLYAMAPPQNYYYGRPHGYKVHNTDHAYYMPRAVSETRIPQAGTPYIPYRPQFGSQNNVFMMPTSGQRFYHSQPMAPVYELPPARGMEIYDYPYPGVNGGLRSKLLETRHTPDYYKTTGEFILRPRVERAKSDAENKKPKSPQPRKEQSKGISPSSAEISQRPATIDYRNWHNSSEEDKIQYSRHSEVQRPTHTNVYRPLSELSVGVPAPYKVNNFKAVSLDYLPIRKDAVALENTTSNTETVNSSATDSMKILAKNKTDDQKIKPNFPPVAIDSNDNRLDENDREFNVKHYTYEGSIYALPTQNKNGDYDNPIISRMKEMVLERSRNSNILDNSNNWDNSAPVNSARNSSKQTSVMKSDQYKDITKVTQITKTKVIESVTTGSPPNLIPTTQTNNTFNDIVDGLVLPDILVPDDEISFAPQHKLTNQHISSNKTVSTVEPKSKSKEFPSVVTEHINDGLYPKESKDIDACSDDLNRAGKQIATSAFEFLDNYLSDDEGTESVVESPPLSPVQRVGRVY